MLDLYSSLVRYFKKKSSKNIMMSVLMVTFLGVYVSFVGQQQIFTPHAQTVNDPNFYCLGACPTPSPEKDATACDEQAVLDAADFQQNTQEACGTFYGNAVDRLIQQAGGACQSRDQAKQALDAACVNYGYNPSHNDVVVPNCSCQMIIQSQEFINNRDVSCGQFQSDAVDRVYSNLATQCTTRDQAQQAVQQACTGVCPVISPTASVSPISTTAMPSAAASSTITPSTTIPVSASITQAPVVATPTPCVTVTTQPHKSHSIGSGILAMFKAFIESILHFFGITISLTGGDPSNTIVTTPCVSAPVQTIDTTANPSTDAASVKSACSVEMLVTNQQFLDNQVVACGSAKSIAVDQFFSNPVSGCTSKDQAQATMDAACKQLGH